METNFVASLQQFGAILGATCFMVFFFGFCIFIHELGHFLTARLCGLHVIAFSIGFKKIWGKKIGGVEYRIGCIPFGGYVDLPQIDSTTPPVDENGNPLPKAAPWARALTAFAGPFFNFLFGLFLGCFIWFFGLPQDTPKLDHFKVQSIEEESPEYRAGLRPGDVIVKLNGKSFNTTWSDFARSIMLEVGDTKLEIQRGGKTMDIVYKTQVNPKIAPEEKIAYPFFRPEIPVYLYPDKGSAAEKAGIRKGDLLVSVDGETINSVEEFEKLLAYSLNRELTLHLKRGKEDVTVKITPEPRGKNPHTDYLIGMVYNYAPGTKAFQVLSLKAGMPAEKVLKVNDQVVAVNGTPVDQLSSLQELFQQTGGAAAEFTVIRDKDKINVLITPEKITLATIGVSYAMRTYPNPIKQFNDVLKLTYSSLRGVIIGLKNKVGLDNRHTTLRPSNFSGPIGIGRFLYISVYRGSIMVGINLVVVITFNLGLLNLLPIPVLDGGHIMLAAFESIFRRPLPAKYLQPVTIAFVTFLIAFMLFVSVFDIKKLFGV